MRLLKPCFLSSFLIKEEKMKHQEGRIEVITGCMFAGKTEELIRRVRRAIIARQKVSVFKPKQDNRYSKEKVFSHNGVFLEAQVVTSALEILEKVEPEVEVVAIDEGQFFDSQLVAACNKLANQGKKVIVAGLDMDFRGEPFGPMGELLARAEEVTKLHAICQVCGEEASFSQRLINGQPASWFEPLILVGAQDVYQARCRKCFQPPSPPFKIQS
jgi:thymidine kinase